MGIMMDTVKDGMKTANPKKWKNRRVLKKLRYFYQCFFLHFVLGLITVTVLFLASFAMEQALCEDGMLLMLQKTVYDFYPPAAYTPKALSAAVLGYAVYMEGETTLSYFDPEGLAFPDVQNPLNPAFSGSDSQNKRASAGIADASDDPIAQRQAIKESGDSLYQYDRTQVKKGQSAVIPMDLSSMSLYTAENQGILFSNQTAYEINPTELLSRDYPIAPAECVPAVGTTEDTAQKPLVLILHTHGTEAYAPEGCTAVDSTFYARSENIEENVVSVGTTLTETLEAAGIEVLHCTTMFDAESYPQAYTKAAAYIKETVAAYPSIQYVFDVHRDALATAKGDILRPVTEVDGDVSAQVMCVVGTDEAGANHAGWRDNLTVAVRLQKRLNTAYPAFARPIKLRSATFNAQYAPGSLLLEIGSSGNSVEEARSAAYYLGCVMAEMILQGD